MTASDRFQEIESYTCVWQSHGDFTTRLVLSHLQWRELPFGFILKDGWYAVVVPEIVSADEAQAIAARAKTFAHSSLAAKPIAVFRQYVEVS